MTASASLSQSSALAMEMTDLTVPSLSDPSQVVLEGVNWSVAKGDYWAVGGLLRSGKSDLMALAAGLSQPIRGTYRLLGQELVAGFEQERVALQSRIGLVFDGGKLLHHLTLAENIALPLRYHKESDGAEDDARLEALVEFTGLAPWMQKYPAELNRNWQQRIGLARALALRPEILLLDSPLSSLDPRDAAWWLETIDALAAGHAIVGGRALTLIVTGDDLRPWRSRARQFAVLKNKAFIPLGSRADLPDHTEPLLDDLLQERAAKT